MAAEEQSIMEQLLASSTGGFKWPDEVLLYHLPLDQELVPDTSRRLCFQTYLRLSKLSFTTKVVPNANSMSPDGVSPFIVLQLGENPIIMSNFEALVSFLEKQHLGLDSEAELIEKVDQEAFISLVKMKILPAQEYQMWANRANLSETLKVSGCGLPWPVNKVLPPIFLFRYVWDQWSTFIQPQHQILRDFEEACHTLSQRLGKKETFSMTRLTVLDVVVYSHLQAVLSPHHHHPGKELKNIILQYQNLINLCEKLSQLEPLTHAHTPEL